MEILNSVFQAEMFQRVGWTLVHFVWQGVAIGLMLAIVLRVLRKSSADLRYLIACAALVVIVVMPVVTFNMVDVVLPVVAVESIEQVVVDLPVESSEAILFVEMPDVELPAMPVAVVPSVSFEERFVGAVELSLPYVVIGWLVGVFGLSLWHLGGWRQLQKLRRQMVKDVSPVLKTKLRQLCDVMGIERAVGLVESALVRVPTVVGHFKPMILLPASALTGLSVEQIEAILAHELAHIKRCDYLVNMLQTVVEIIGFYHPAVWWILRKIRVERENCCDDLAVSVSGDKLCYAKALTSMEEIRGGQGRLAIAASGGSLFDRVGRLLGNDSASEGKLSWLPSVLVMLLIVAMLMPAAWAMSSGGKESVIEKDDTVAEVLADVDGFKAKRANGVEVELVGLCEHPSEGKQWWTGDGSLLDERPWKKLNSSVMPSRGNKSYEFAIKLNYPENNAPGYYAHIGNGSGASGGLGDSVNSDLRWEIAELSKKDETTDVKFAIASGQWKTQSSQDSPWQGVYVVDEVVWQGPIAVDGKTVISVTHKFTKGQCQLIAIDVKGKEYVGYGTSGSVDGKSSNMQMTFKVKLGRIKEFKLQTRPYEYYTFRDVSLRPDAESDVAGILSEPNVTSGVVREESEAELESEKLAAIPSEDFDVELVGVCEYPSAGKQWWGVDGEPLGYDITTSDSSSYSSDDPGYEIVMKKTGRGAFKLHKISGSKMRSGLTVVEPEGLIAYRVHVNKRYKKIDVEIAVESGKWETLLETNGVGSTATTDKRKRIVFANKQKDGNATTISYSNDQNYKEASRVIAIDADGKEYVGIPTTDTSINGLQHRVSKFEGILPEDISLFKFQTCPYEYRKFKNVRLEALSLNNFK